MYFFSLGQNFLSRQKSFCPGQKIFCPSRWTGHKRLPFNFHEKCPLSSSLLIYSVLLGAWLGAIRAQILDTNINYFLFFISVSSWIQNSSRSQIPHGSAHWYCCIPLRGVWKSFYHSRQIATSSKISSFKRAPAFMRMVWKRFLARAQTCGASTQSPHWRKTIQMQHVRPEIHRFKVFR